VGFILDEYIYMSTLFNTNANAPEHTVLGAYKKYEEISIVTCLHTGHPSHHGRDIGLGSLKLQSPAGSPPLRMLGRFVRNEGRRCFVLIRPTYFRLWVRTLVRGTLCLRLLLVEPSNHILTIF